MLVSSVSTIHASVGDKTTARDVESLLLTYLNSLDNTIALQEDTVSVSNLMYAEMLCQSQEWVLLYFNEVSLNVAYRDWETDRKSTRLNSSHSGESRMPSSA